MTNEKLVSEARRLENDYGDNYEVMLHMSALADALEAAESRVKELEAATERESDLQHTIDDLIEELAIADDLVEELAIARKGRQAALDIMDAHRCGEKNESIMESLVEARAERDAALAAIERVRALHHKITRYGNDQYSIHAESYEDDPSSYDDLEPFDLCAECYEVERMICEECGGDAPIGHRSSWPCPTIAALDGAPEPEEKP